MKIRYRKHRIKKKKNTFPIKDSLFFFLFAIASLILSFLAESILETSKGEKLIIFITLYSFFALTHLVCKIGIILIKYIDKVRLNLERKLNHNLLKDR